MRRVRISDVLFIIALIIAGVFIYKLVTRKPKTLELTGQMDIKTNDQIVQISGNGTKGMSLKIQLEREGLKSVVVDSIKIGKSGQFAARVNLSRIKEPLSDGVYIIRVRSNDEKFSKSVRVTYDTQPPPLQITQVTAMQITGRTEPGAVVSSSIDEQKIAVQPDGSFSISPISSQVTLTAVDEAGNKQTREFNFSSVYAQSLIDEARETIKVASAQDKDTQRAEWVLRQALKHFDAKDYQLAQQQAVRAKELAETATEKQKTVSQMEEQVSTEKPTKTSEQSVKIQPPRDLTVPEVEIYAPQDGEVSRTNTITVLGKVADKDSGIRTITLNPTPLNPIQFDADKGEFSAEIYLDEGNQKIALDATDDAGNRNSASREVIIFTGKIGVAEINLPTKQNQHTRADEIEIKGMVYSPSMISKLTINDEQVSVSRDGEFQKRIPLNRDGKYTFSISTSYRGISETSSDTCVVIRDTAPPEIQHAPIPEILTASEIQLIGKVLDGEQPQQLIINGIQQPMDSDGVFNTTVRGLKRGKNTIVIKAIDRAGNDTEMSSEVTVDLSPPELLNVKMEPDRKTFRIGEKLSISGKVQDDTAIKSLEVRFDEVSQPSGLSEDNSFLQNLTLSQLGEHSIQLFAIDLANQKSETVTLELEVVDEVLGPAEQLIDRGKYQDAIKLYEAMKPEDEHYLIAQWNVVTLSLYFSKHVNADKALKALTQIEKVNTDWTNKRAYFLLYRGMALYQKGTGIQALIQGDTALNLYRRAAIDLDEAYERRRDFSKTNLDNVRHHSLHKNIHDVMYYAAMSYYQLYKWVKVMSKNEDAVKYKTTAKTRFDTYFLNRPFKSTDSTDAVFIPEHELAFYKPEYFKPFLESARNAYSTLLASE